MPDRAERESLWQEPVESLLQTLDTTVNGLSSAEARKRLARYGPNTLATTRPSSLVSKLAQRLRNPLVLVLLFAAAISAFTGDVASFVIISSMVVLSIVLDSIQEHRAQRAADRLKGS